MGGTTFTNRAKGPTAQEAFNASVREAQHEYGHGGYTGTIAEKNDFVMLKPPILHDGSKEAKEALRDYIDRQCSENPQIQDKYGPAGCVQVGDDEYVFFGWAAE